MTIPEHAYFGAALHLYLAERFHLRHRWIWAIVGTIGGAAPDLFGWIAFISGVGSRWEVYNILHLNEILPFSLAYLQILPLLIPAYTAHLLTDIPFHLSESWGIEYLPLNIAFFGLATLLIKKSVAFK